MKFLVTLILVATSIFAAAQDYKLEGHEIVLSKSIAFKTGSYELLPESKEVLAIIKNYLDAKTYISLIRVEAHVDNSGDAEKNQLLTEKRALAISNELVAMGVDCKRLIAVGFGDTKPIADNSTIEGKATNRRVSFFNAALRGRLIGGMPADGNGKVAGEVCK
ncbi:MAG: OmpA family protein [Ferruginibacter sp.]|nr:OmpA family protein [Ferruginibacter sp.]